MHPNLLAAAVPVFFAAIVAEALADRARRTKTYRFGAALADLQAGIVSQVGDVALRGIGVAIYAWVYRHRLVDWPEHSMLPWVVGLVGIDFLYYWWHRLSHLVNLLWAVHAVHHQSEDFNLAVALRQPAFEALTIIPFHLPLALLGVEPWIYVSCYAIDLIYQFWIHTELPGKLGFLEWVVNTPSSHRVHHGIEPKYLDRNYGGILILWDRLFGSYQREEERPTYGVTHAIRSYNPVWANVAPLLEIAARARAAGRLVDKVGIWFSHPAALAPAAERELPAAQGARAKYDPSPSRNVTSYVFAHFVLLVAGGAAFMHTAERAPLSAMTLPGAILLLSVLALSGWVEGRRWALAIDVLRQIAIVGLATAHGVAHFGARGATVAAAALTTIFVLVFVVFRPAGAKSLQTASG